MDKKHSHLRLRIAVFAASFIQIISPVFSSLGKDSDPSAKNDPPITPAGYAFVIWGVITLLSLSYGVYQLLPNRKNAALHAKLGRAFVCVYFLFACWLLAAQYNWLITTVIIFLAMFTLLTLIFEAIINERKKLTDIETIILLGQVALYTGWSTVAIFANTAAAVKYYGIPDIGWTGHAWQAMILIGALFNSLYWIKKFNKNKIYAAAILWAFAGVFFGLRSFENTYLLQIITIAAIVMVVVVLFHFDKMKLQRHPVDNVL